MAAVQPFYHGYDSLAQKLSELFSSHRSPANYFRDLTRTHCKCVWITPLVETGIAIFCKSTQRTNLFSTESREIGK